MREVPEELVIAAQIRVKGESQKMAIIVTRVGTTVKISKLIQMD